MKRTLIAMLLALTLALAMCALSLADVNTPFDDEALNVNVAVKMEEGDVSALYTGVPDGTNLDGLNSELIELSDGVLYFNKTSRPAVWIGFVSDKLADVTKAEGFGFYVKNNTGIDLPVVIALSADPECNLNNDSYTIGSNKEYALIDMDGNKTVVTAPEKPHPNPSKDIISNSQFDIPAEFEGYVVVPLTSLQQVYGDTSTVLPSDAKITGFGWMSKDSGGQGYVNGDLGIDNIFYYGADVEEADAELILGGGSTGSDDEKPSTDPDKDTGDVQLWLEIAVAAAAIIAVAAVAVSKKKKSK